MTLDEILETEQLKFYINCSELVFFTYKPKDAKDLDIVFRSDLSEYLYMNTGIEKTKIECFDPTNNDAYATAIQGSLLRNIILLNRKKISTTNLSLFLGGISQKYLTWILEAEKGKHNTYDEFCYSNGEIVTINGNEVKSNDSRVSYREIKNRLAEAVIIANSQLANSKRKLTISGTYLSRGENPVAKRETFDSEKLNNFAKSENVILNLDQNKFAEYVKKGFLKKWDIVKLINKQILPNDVAVKLMTDGILTEQETCRILGIANIKNISISDKISFATKFFLYSTGKMPISDLEKVAKYEEKENLKLEIEDISENLKYYLIPENKNGIDVYRGNLNKISELLTHNVLDFNQSMTFLDAFLTTGAITNEERNYLTNLMNDFKTSELLNETQNESINASGEQHGSSNYKNGVTIDPEIRKQYFKSIGDVKEIFINGERLISDESEGKTEKNSLDGYQLIIVPDKRVAILEKFYEIKKDNNGILSYRTDKNGNLIPATEQATYVMPIGMAKDFAEKKNKLQLIKSKYIARTFHSMNWTTNTEHAMKKVAERTGIEIEFDKENTNYWSKKIKENYEKLKISRTKDVDELV